MLIYWAMFALPAFPALLSSGRDQTSQRYRVMLGLAFVLLTLVIGFRYEVGADWFNYENMVEATRYEGLATSLSLGDPGYFMIAWISTRVGLGLLGPNLVCGALLMFGLWRFSLRQPNIWMTIAVAATYLVIVVGMGYVRQAAAIGLLFIAINRLEDGKPVHFFKWVAFAALFHVSVISIVPLALLAVVRRSFVATALIAVGGLVLNFILLSDRLASFTDLYVGGEMQSSGATFRLGVNAVPAIIYLLIKNRLEIAPLAKSFWTAMAVLSVLLLALGVFPTLSTLLDRIGLYCIPLQLFVAARVGTLVQKSEGRIFINAAVLLLYGMTLYVWLNYANNAGEWLPYTLFPWEELG